MHSIKTELENFTRNLPADSVTKRNLLEKAGEETKQMLEERWKQKWRKFTGTTENNTTRTLEYSNRLKFC